MKSFSLILATVLSLAVTPFVNATVTVSHVENATVGQFFTSGGVAVPLGGVTVGFFTSNPADASFAGPTPTIFDWATMLAAGWHDVREYSTSAPDWDFPIPVAGSASGIPIADLPANTQLYIVGFNAGTFNEANRALSFTGATEWAVAKDGLSPADLGTKVANLGSGGTTSLVTVLAGTANGINVNMTSIGAGPVPEPSRLILLGLGGMGLLFRRRRC
jgi:PEP-CTERM motif